MPKLNFHRIVTNSWTPFMASHYDFPMLVEEVPWAA